MSLSLEELSHVVGIFAPVLRSGRVRAVHDDGDATLYVTIRVPGENLMLVLSAARGVARVSIAPGGRPRAPAQPLAFTQQLRKHLVGGVVDELRLAVEGDRLAALDVRHGAPTDDDADASRWSLIAELTGRNANLMLLDGEHVARGALRWLGSTRPGEEWSPPPPPPSRPAAAHRNRFADVAADTARETAEDDDDEREGALRAAVALGAAIEAHFEREVRRQRRRGHHEAMGRAVRRQLTRARRRLRAVERDLSRAEEAADANELGDILAANFDQLERGMERIELGNFYDEMRPLEIELDPTLSPRENVDRYYARHKKYRSAISSIRERADTAETRALELQLVAEALAELQVDDDADATTPDPTIDDDLARIAEQLDELGVVWHPAQKRQRRRETRAAQKQAATPTKGKRPYRAFRSATGIPIWVGRSARDNDALTFRHGRGGDIWLHAAGWPGSHVLVRLERGQDGDSRTLVDAATLAAHYSKASTGSVIEVHYTQQKHVRRARGSKPGQVYLANARTIAIRIDEDRLRRLLATSSD